MSKLLEKSTQSLNSAEFLVKENYYSSTVNRAYYASLQFILHVLVEKLKIDTNDIMNAPKEGTHSKAAYLMGLELIKKNKEDYKWFQAKFTEFKKQRVLADYYGNVIEQNEGHSSITLAKSIISLMKKNFK